MMKKLILITLLAATTTSQVRPINDINRWGMMGAGLILTSAGAHTLLYRYHNEISHRMLDTLIGVGLIAVGLYSIAAPDKIIRFIERSLR